MIVEFKVPGIPRAWARTRKGYNRHIGREVWYPTPENLGQRQMIRTFALSAIRGNRPDFPWAGPIIAGFCFLLPRPRRVTQENSHAPTAKPDLDNLEKLVLEALTDVIWRDDRQVVGWLPFPLHGKVYADGSVQPQTGVLALRLSDYFRNWKDIVARVTDEVNLLKDPPASRRPG